MLTAFSCATADNIPQLLVTLSSFKRYNPTVPVLVFHERSTNIDLLKVLDVTFVPLGNPRLLLAALDYLIQKRIDMTGRVVYLSSNTLVKDSITEFSHVGMDGVGLATQHFWALPKLAKETRVYEEADEITTRRRKAINPRYFSTDFMLLNLDALRETEFPSLLLTFVGSKLADEEELLNFLFEDKPIVFMPSDLGTRVESISHLLVESRDIAFHTAALRRARVVVFPGDVKPWTPHRRFNRLTAQFPMAVYLEEVEQVEGNLPKVFVNTAVENTAKHRSFFRELPETMTTIKAMLSECDPL